MWVSRSRRTKFEKLYQFEVYETKEKREVASYILTWENINLAAKIMNLAARMN